jgi:uncharacterized membrane-anchored protein
MAAPLVFNSDADQRGLEAVVVVGAIGAVGFVFYLLGRFVSFVLTTTPTAYQTCPLLSVMDY